MPIPRYTLDGWIEAVIVGAALIIPPGHRLFAEIVAAGPVAAYEPPPPSFPVAVSPYQAREALLDAGLLAQVEAAVA